MRRSSGTWTEKRLPSSSDLSDRCRHGAGVLRADRRGIGDDAAGVGHHHVGHHRSPSNDNDFYYYHHDDHDDYDDYDDDCDRSRGRRRSGGATW
jgi:hypothetical protein